METSRIEFLEPLRDVASWFRGLVPTSFKPGKTHFNFITVHYLYLIALSILGSIILYPSHLMSFTDSLFFAVGAATQSGLNTIDVNKMQTYQQVTLMLIACVANPVFINTAVVFIRLHWFEKRFQGIVKEAIKTRRAKTISRSRSQAREDSGLDPELGANSHGVGEREIKVLHDPTKPNGLGGGAANGRATESLRSPKSPTSVDPNVNAIDHAVDTSPKSPQQTFLGRNPALQRDIVFADEEPKPKLLPSRRNSEDERYPQQRPTEDHIAFLERQRNSQQGTLRIPGPRDFDRGDTVRQIDSDDEELDHTITRDGGPQQPNPARVQTNDTTDTPNGEANPARRGIAFDVPDHPNKEALSEDSDESHKARFNPLRPFSTLKPKRRMSTNTFSKTLVRLRDTPRAFTRTFSRTASQDHDMPDMTPYLSWQPTIGRNSQFIDLSEEQREELGGIEYRSLKTLCIILVCYYIGFHLLGMLILLPWIVTSKTYGPIPTGDGMSRAWWGIFTPASMFNDLGLTLTPDSMISFQSAILPLLVGSFLIVIGNTGFPCMLRFTIWVVSVLTPRGSALYDELRFLLDHPRRCFTLLFPSKATWWLFWLLVLLNGIDLLFFIILDLNDETVTSLPVGIRFLVGWFQAVSTRTAGFAAVNLADLHPAIQVSYLVMMYISVFPIAISVRRTNVYEEKSLGLWGSEDEEDENSKSYVSTHLRRQLSFDLWYIFLGLFVIAIVEGKRIQNNADSGFTMFAVLFEIVSAYGTVGLSLGYPGIDASFSAEFATISKLIIIAMMLRGRHRGLPYALDRAILLPSENRFKKESEEAAARANRRASMSIGKAPTDERDNINHAVESQSILTATTSAPLGPQSSSNSPAPVRRMHSRRLSEMSGTDRSTSSRNRGKSLAHLVVSGLTAGPTSPRSFKKD